MTPNRLSDILGKDIVLTRYNNQGRRWSAHIDDCECKNGIILSFVYGDGNTPRLALKDLAKRLQGKYLVVNAMRKNRMEYAAPAKLTV